LPHLGVDSGAGDRSGPLIQVEQRFAAAELGKGRLAIPPQGREGEDLPSRDPSQPDRKPASSAMTEIFSRMETATFCICAGLILIFLAPNGQTIVRKSARRLRSRRAAPGAVASPPG